METKQSRAEKKIIRGIQKRHYDDVVPAFGLDDLLKKKLRMAALNVCKGNKIHTAMLLGCSNRAVRIWCKEYEDQGEIIPDFDPETRGQQYIVTKDMQELIDKVLNF